MFGLYFRDNSKNLHKIDVTVNSYFAVLDGQKVYNRGRTINLVVNPEHYTLIDLEKDVDSYFKWGSCQKPIFWVVEKGDKWQCKLTSDAQLSDLVSSFDLVKLFMTMGRCKEGEETLHVVTDVVGKEMLAAAYPVGKEMDVDNIVYEEMHVDEVIGTTDNGEEGMHEDMDKQPEWREVPEYGQTTAGAPVVDLMDKIREKIMEKIATRQDIANRLEGHILPSVLHELNMKSRGLNYDFSKSGLLAAEISGTTNEGKTWRYGVDLNKRTCGCGQWEVSGKPCTHAIFSLGKFRQKELKIEDFVDDYYSVERFKLAYQFEVIPMGDKSQWPKNDPGFEMVPPPLERPAGRPRKQRIKASGEPGKRGPYQCKRCFKFGHIEKGCNATQAELEQELPPPRPKKQKKQSKTKSEAYENSTKGAEPSNIDVDPKLTSSPGVTTRRMASLSPARASPCVTTRRMASLSPTSPGVSTRRMAFISPGGINRRLIID